MTENEWGVRYRTLLACDPGDIHVGLAEFVEDEEGWSCVRAYELPHLEAADAISQFVVGGDLDVLVVERFALYADKAMSQVGSEMLTAQLIGVIKYIHRLYSRSVEAGRAVKPSNGQPSVPCRLVVQPASIQKPTAAILRAKKVKSEANGNPHAKSAELHGWHLVMREMNG